MRENEAVIRIDGLRKYYRPSRETVLEIPELNLANNIYWLKGSNGSGKTTLIKVMAGLLPFEGSILVNGVNCRRDRMKYRMIVNYAEAEPLYPDFLTGKELIYFYAETKKASREQVASMIDRLGLGHFINEKCGGYSSGMLKKLSLALAFLGHPTLILLDEPLITLDQSSLSIITGMITDFQQQGVCIFMASHQEFDSSHALQPQILRLINKGVS